MTKEKNCGSCAYYAQSGRDKGQCKRFPPVPVMEFTEIKSVFPAVFHYMLCGEYQHQCGEAELVGSGPVQGAGVSETIKNRQAHPWGFDSPLCKTNLEQVKELYMAGNDRVSIAQKLQIPYATAEQYINEIRREKN